MGTQLMNYEFLVRFDPDTGDYSGSHFKYWVRSFDETGMDRGNESDPIPVKDLDGPTQLALTTVVGDLVVGFSAQLDRVLAQVQTAAEENETLKEQLAAAQQQVASLQAANDILAGALP